MIEFDRAGHKGLMHTQYRVKKSLKRKSHQILLSEMSLPGIEVLIGEVFSIILGR